MIVALGHNDNILAYQRKRVKILDIIKKKIQYMFDWNVFEKKIVFEM